VHGLARDRARGKILESMGCAPIIGNLLTNGPWERAIERFDVAIGCTKPGRRNQPPAMAQVPELLKSHTDAYSHLLNAVHDAKLRGVILTMGALSYGDHGDEWVDEDTPLDPVGYGRFLGPARPGLTLLAQSRRVKAIFMMPGWVYGDGGWFQEQLVPAVKEGQARIVSDGGNYMSFVQADDLAEAYVLAAEGIGYAPPPEERPETETLNLVDDQPLLQKEWLGAVCQALGQPAPSSISKEECAKQAGELWAESVTCSTRIKNDRAKELLGWKPQYPTIKEGLAATLSAAPSRS
jgi:nucleoside-diphosphate-sugar epimerase